MTSFEPDEDELLDDVAVPPDPAEVLDLLGQQMAVLIAAATAYDKPAPRDRDYQQIRQKTERGLRALGITPPFPWRTLEIWRGEWSQHGTYAQRRSVVRNRARPIQESLQRRIDDRAAGDADSQITALGTSTGKLVDPSGVRLQLQRIERALNSDPGTAINAAKSLVESTAKAVLHSLGEPVDEGSDLPKLVYRASTALNVHPSATEDAAVKKLLGHLNAITDDVAELRNSVGAGHGHLIAPDVELRHGRLAARSAVAWCAFMLETLAEVEA